MEVRIVVGCVVLLLAGSCAAVLPVLTHVHSKFEYQSSFKGPYLVNSKGDVPFWNHGGSCIPSDDQVRVCPSIKSRRGWIWTKSSFSAKHWMLDVSLRVTGRLKTGADGLAIWFTSSVGSEGLAFGNTEIWTGLGIVLDSFDNNGKHDNPKIMAVMNDGIQRFDHSGDGLMQEVGSCMKDFRNKPNPVKLRIVYLRGTLEVWVHDGMSSLADDYQLCLKTETTTNIPLEGYFGVTAATGGLSDDHDVLQFITHRLTPLEEHAQEKLLQEINKKEADEVADKYSSLSNQFDQQRQDYLKDHDDMGIGDWQYEIEMEQNVRHIANMQSQLSRDILQLSVKVDSLLSGGGAGRDQRGTPDLTSIKNTEATILQKLTELRSVVDGGQGSKVASEQMQPLFEVKNIVQQNSQRLAGLEQRAKEAAAHQCPTVTSDPPSCVSPTFFLVVIVMELVLILGYLLYRQRQDAVAKKFF